MLTCDFVRRGLCVLIMLSGCNGLFEINPGFDPETDGGTGSGSGVATTTTTTTMTQSTGVVASTDASSSTTDDGSEATAEIPVMCGVDENEPNEEISQTDNFGEVVSGGEALSIEAQLDEPSDEDWYKIGIDQAGALIPTPRVRAWADHPLNVCLLVACASEVHPTVECGDAVYMMDGAGLRQGCCADDLLEFSYSCGGESEDRDGWAYLGVKQATATDVCVPYDVRFSV